MNGSYGDVWRGVAEAAPERHAVLTRDDVYSYRRLAREAAAFAAHLTAVGVRAGDAVAILSYNRPEYLVVLFACLAIGVAPVPINFRYRTAEVVELLRDSAARMLVFPTSLGDVAASAARALDPAPALVEIADGGGATPGATAFADLVSATAQLPETSPPEGEIRLYTGGTTGRPKAVVWRTRDLFDVQLYPTYGALGLPIPDTVAEAVSRAIAPSTPHIVTFPLAPFMHGTALFNSMNTLLLGGTVVIHASARLDADEAVRLISDLGVTRLIVAGDAVALPLVEAAERAGVARLGAVDSVISSGMRFGALAKTRLHALGDIEINDMLASTEGGPYAVNITRSADDLPGRLRLLPGAIVLDDENNEVQDEPGRRGRLAYRGALPRGYWQDEAKTQATFPIINGKRYVIPGDWALTLPDGDIELLGRGSAVVNTGGEKVYPAEVEEALLEHPGIRDAVVFGMPDDRYGEVVTAVVVAEEGETLDLDDVRTLLDTRLAGYKKPRRIIVRDSLERSPHGKVDLALLKELAAASS